MPELEAHAVVEKMIRISHTEDQVTKGKKDWSKDKIPAKSSFDAAWPVEIQERVLKRWKEYGYQS